MQQELTIWEHLSASKLVKHFLESFHFAPVSPPSPLTPGLLNHKSIHVAMCHV